MNNYVLYLKQNCGNIIYHWYQNIYLIVLLLLAPLFCSIRFSCPSPSFLVWSAEWKDAPENLRFQVRISSPWWIQIYVKNNVRGMLQHCLSHQVDIWCTKHHDFQDILVFICAARDKCRFIFILISLGQMIWWGAYAKLSSKWNRTIQCLGFFY